MPHQGTNFSCDQGFQAAEWARYGNRVTTRTDSHRPCLVRGSPKHIVISDSSLHEMIQRDKRLAAGKSEWGKEED